MPQVSPYGGGSSFSGLSQLPLHRELTTRYQQIEWPPSVVQTLLHEEFRRLFTIDELKFLESLNSDNEC